MASMMFLRENLSVLHCTWNMLLDLVLNMFPLYNLLVAVLGLHIVVQQDKSCIQLLLPHYSFQAHMVNNQLHHVY